MDYPVDDDNDEEMGRGREGDGDEERGVAGTTREEEQAEEQRNRGSRALEQGHSERVERWQTSSDAK